jgi:hypothetical protein
MGYEDNMAYFRRKLTSDILLRDNGSVCNEFKNPGPCVQAEKIVQVVCSRCVRNLKSGTPCKTCGRWFHNSCGNVKSSSGGERELDLW